MMGSFRSVPRNIFIVGIYNFGDYDISRGTPYREFLFKDYDEDRANELATGCLESFPDAIISIHKGVFLERDYT